MQLRLKHVGILVLTLVALSVVASPVVAQSKFENPLGDAANDPKIVINRVIDFMLGLAGVLALAALVWGGILYIISVGNDNYVQMAKKIIFWALVGLIVIILAFAIVNTTARFLGRGI